MESLKISSRKIGDVTIFDLSGDFILGAACDDFRAAINKSLDNGECKILINFAGVKAFDSQAVGDIVKTHEAIRRHQGDIKFLCPTEKIQRSFSIKHLDSIFKCYAEEKDAILAFGLTVVIHRMETDLNRAIQEQDSNRLSTIRTAALEKALSLKDRKDFEDLAARFQAMSDQANEALIPLCGE